MPGPAAGSGHRSDSVWLRNGLGPRRRAAGGAASRHRTRHPRFACPPPRTAGARGQRGVPMAVVGVGMVGGGGVATRHAAAIARFSDAELVAVADPVPERAATLAARYGAAS